MAEPDKILKLPYHWVLRPDDDGTWMGVIMEFPGCIATGDTAAEALGNLATTAESWLLSIIARGQKIPQPSNFVTRSK
jgi:predicted RNase H-like HicB family nuclease